MSEVRYVMPPHVAQACGRVLLVGELNPYGSPPAFALWDEPAGAAGDRLRRILGLRSEVYRAIHRTNLCSGSWSLPRARARARALLFPTPDPPWPWLTVVALGRKVADAFAHVLGWKSLPFFTGDVESVGGMVMASLPHPSGRCRVWNEHDAVLRARTLLERCEVYVPWGTAEDAL